MTTDLRYALKPYHATHELLASFNPLHVELLLNQSADLLDRALATAEQIRGLRAQEEFLRISVEKDKKLVAAESTRRAETSRDGLTEFSELKKRIDREDSDSAERALVDLDEAVRSAERAHEAANGEFGSKHAANVIWANARAARERMNCYAQLAMLNRSLGSAETQYVVDERQALSDSLQNTVSAQSAEGPLNFNVHITNLNARLERDRNDAFLRLVKANDGLEHLYGELYADWKSRNADSDRHRELPAQAGDLEVLVRWNRDAISFMAALLQVEQGFTLSVSLKTALGGSWSSLSGQIAHPMKFRVPAIPEFTHIRLRSVSASLVSHQLEVSPWTLRIAPPPQVVTSKSNGATEAISRHVTLGRVESFQIPRPVEAVGVVTLFNMSPWGRGDDSSWTISIVRPESAVIDFDALADIRLELSLVGFPVSP